MKASETQIGGDHYKGMAIQPFEYITRNGIPFAEGCAIKYLSRWRSKNGVEDLKKARHFIDLLIEHQESKETTATSESIADAFIPYREWPAKYEVGMRFLRKDGFAVVCKSADSQVGYMTRKENDGMGVWFYKHQRKTDDFLSQNHPGAELVEYLGKI